MEDDRMVAGSNFSRASALRIPDEPEVWSIKKFRYWLAILSQIRMLTQ